MWWRGFSNEVIRPMGRRLRLLPPAPPPQPPEAAFTLPMQAAPGPDPALSYRGYLGITGDVSSQWQSERAQRQSQALLKLAAGAGGLGAWSIDGPDMRLTLSEEACGIFEYPVNRQPGLRDIFAFCASESADALQAALDGCLTRGESFDVELDASTLRGRQIWVRMVGMAERDAESNILSAHGALHDITRLKAATERAQSVAEQLQATLERLPVGFMVVDRSWCFQYINPAAESLMQRPRELLIGEKLWRVFPDPAPSPFAAAFQRVMDKGTTEEFEAHYAPLDIWAHVVAYPSDEGITICFRNETPRVRAQQETLELNASLEERVRQRTAELQQANRELESFSYSIAHDLRGPLGAIAGFSQVVQETEPGLGARARHHLARIRQAARHMDQMTDGLLALARLSRTPVQAVQVDLAPMARAIVQGLQQQEPQRALRLTIAPALPVNADAVLAHLLLTQLIGNAWKFTARRDEAFIEIGVVDAGQLDPVFYVKDNGVGFDMQHAGKLFQVFHRLHTSEEFAGTGIGLATAHKIVSRHGGRVWAQATEGEGATFFFTLG